MRRVRLLLVTAVLTMAVPFGVTAQTHEAARTGDLAALKALLERDPAQANAVDATNVTPLHLLAGRNDTAGIRLLLAHGATVDPRDVSARTPLHRAAMNDAVEAAALLLEQGAELEARDSYQRTALLLATRERGGLRMVELLLGAHAEVNVLDRFQSDPLELAAWRGKVAVVDRLLAAGARLPTDERKSHQLLWMAAENSVPRLFEALCATGLDLQQNPDLLHAAAGGGAVEIVNALLDRGFASDRPDRNGWTPLHFAARDGRLAAVRALLARGAPRDSRTLMGQSALNVAQELKHDSVAAYLVAEGADNRPVQFPALAGDYLGQPPPGDEPQIFARGIVSSVWGLHSTAAVSPDGNTIAWAPMVMVPGRQYSQGGVLLSERRSGRWTAPAYASFTGDEEGDVPFFSPDRTRVYFISTKDPAAGSASGRERIWFAERSGDGWGEPQPVDETVNRYPHHWQISVDRDHTIYFASRMPDGLGGGDIYRARYVGGRWQEPAPLGPPVNTAGDEGMPFIAADGSYLLLSRDFDLYISYRQPDGGFGEAVRLPEPINSPAVEICPIVSPDGKYLFFLSQRGAETEAWWVSAGFIERMRPR